MQNLLQSDFQTQTTLAWWNTMLENFAPEKTVYKLDEEFYYIINEWNTFYLTGLDFLYLQKDTYIPIQFLDINYSILQ